MYTRTLFAILWLTIGSLQAMDESSCDFENIPAQSPRPLVFKREEIKPRNQKSALPQEMKKEEDKNKDGKLTPQFTPDTPPLLRIDAIFKKIANKKATPAEKDRLRVQALRYINENYLPICEWDEYGRRVVSEKYKYNENGKLVFFKKK